MLFEIILSICTFMNSFNPPPFQHQPPSPQPHTKKINPSGGYDCLIKVDTYETGYIKIETIFSCK